MHTRPSRSLSLIEFSDPLLFNSPIPGLAEDRGNIGVEASANSSHSEVIHVVAEGSTSLRLSEAAEAVEVGIMVNVVICLFVCLRLVTCLVTTWLLCQDC